MCKKNISLLKQAHLEKFSWFSLSCIVNNQANQNSVTGINNAPGFFFSIIAFFACYFMLQYWFYSFVRHISMFLSLNHCWVFLVSLKKQFNGFHPSMTYCFSFGSLANVSTRRGRHTVCTNKFKILRRWLTYVVFLQFLGRNNYWLQKLHINCPVIETHSHTFVGLTFSELYS